MNAGKTIEFFTKRAEELKPEEKPVEAAKVDQTVETKTDDTQKVESDKAEQPGEDGTAVSTVKEEVKAEKEAEEKTAAVTAKDVANMLATLAKNPTNTGVIAGAGLGSILSALGSISRSNDPKKKKSVVTNPALLGAVGTGTGYLGGNYLESIRPEDVQVAKERVLQKVNRGLEFANEKAKNLLNIDTVKKIPTEVAGDIRQTAKGVKNLLWTGVKSDLGLGALGLTGLNSLVKNIALRERLDHLKSLNPTAYLKLRALEKEYGSLGKAMEELRIPALMKKYRLAEKLRALDPWSREGRQWGAQLGQVIGMDGELKNSKKYMQLLQRIREAESKIRTGITTGVKSEDISALQSMRALARSNKMKALNLSSKAMQILGRVLNPRRGLRGKAALVALLGSLGYGYNRMKGNGEAK